MLVSPVSRADDGAVSADGGVEVGRSGLSLAAVTVGKIRRTAAKDKRIVRHFRLTAGTRAAENRQIQ